MKRKLEFFTPQNLNEASRMAKARGAALFAGGTDVLGCIKKGTTASSSLVNLKLIKDLSSVNSVPGEGLFLGSALKISSLISDPVVTKGWPLLSRAAEQVASPQLRNMATLGGNLCQRPRCWYFRGSYPCLRKGGDTCFAVDGENKYHCITGGDGCYIVHPSDLATALRAMDASVEIYDAGQTKTVSLDRFFVLPEEDDTSENILKSGQIISRIFIPEKPGKTKNFYYKHSERGSWDFAIVSLAATARFSGTKINSAKLVFGGVAPIPWVEEELNSALPGTELNEKNIIALSLLAFKSADPLEKNGYKIVLARNLVKKALRSFAGID